MMLSLCTGISFTPPFLGKKSMELYTVGEKNCVREMAVEVVPSPVVLGLPGEP